MTNDKDSAVLAELLETMRERCADPCRSEKAELGCDCDAARRAAVMLRQPTQSDALVAARDAIRGLLDITSEYNLDSEQAGRAYAALHDIAAALKEQNKCP